MSRQASFGDLDVSLIYFTHARVRPFFSGCGRRLEDTLDMIWCGDMSLDKLPQITILFNTMHDGQVYYFSLNNRRLWVLKELHARGYFEGKLHTVRLKEALPRERERYTIDRCSLTAKIMKEGALSSLNSEGQEESDIGTEVVGESGDNKLAGNVVFGLKSLSLTPGHEDAAVGNSVSSTEVGSAPAKQGVAPARSSAALPLPLPLPSMVAKEARELAAVWKKGKKGEQRVRSQVDEWIEAGVIQVNQEQQVYTLITK